MVSIIQMFVIQIPTVLVELLKLFILNTSQSFSVNDGISPDQKIQLRTAKPFAIGPNKAGPILISFFDAHAKYDSSKSLGF